LRREGRDLYSTGSGSRSTSARRRIDGNPWDGDNRCSTLSDRAQRGRLPRGRAEVPVPGEKLRMSSFAQEAEARLQPPSWRCPVGIPVQICRNVGDDEHGRLLPPPFREESTSPTSGRFPGLLPVRGDSRGGRDGRADHPVEPGSMIRVSPEDLPLDDIRRARPPSRRPRRPPAILAARTAGPRRPVVLDAEKVQEGRRNFCPCAITSWPRDTSRGCSFRSLGEEAPGRSCAVMHPGRPR